MGDPRTSDEYFRDKRERLLKEQEAFFRKEGPAVKKAREGGVGFLYDEAGAHGRVKEKEEEARPEDAIPDLPGTYETGLGGRVGGL